VKKPTATEEKLLEIQTRLEHWNCFVGVLRVPSELAPAFMTRRSELVRLAPRRPLSAEECGVLYDLVAGLLETNEALRAHAALVAEISAQQEDALGGALRAIRRARAFANFSTAEEVDAREAVESTE
jgi:hypothetical protein